ncbi:glycine zipper 2TM domain-containing protein [bacterium]|nr:MAG: glycine zipper 2TM domain-containing protein [bacterium]
MEQIEKDKYECYVWAKSESGYDPLNLGDKSSQSSTVPPPEPQRSVGSSAAKGGLGGALLGAGLGALLGGKRGALTGAAIGGIGGAVVGSESQKSENQREAERQRLSEQARTEDEKRDKYERAFSACLEGRGYIIK